VRWFLRALTAIGSRRVSDRARRRSIAVTETDAFGNPIDGPAPSVVPAHAPSGTSWGARLVGLLVIAAFVAPFAIGGWVAWNALHTAKTATAVIKGVRDLAPTPAAHAPPAGVSGTSMLAARNLDRALASARRDPGGRLGLLRLAPERADLHLTRRGGGIDLLQLRADGGRSLVRMPGDVTRKAIIFSTIDRAAPSRLVRRAARRLGRSPKAIDYVVLIDILGAPRWSAYFRGGAAFAGDAHGAITSRIQ
jgi:hypothetical protein